MSEPRLDQTYSFGDVVRFSGATQSNVTHWVREGLVEAITPAAGSGHHRRFSFLNLLEASIAAEFSRLGMTVAQMFLPIRLVRALARNSAVTPGTAPSEWVAVLTDRVTKAEFYSAADAKMLAGASINDIVSKLLHWRLVADRSHREKFEAAGVQLSMSVTPPAFGFFAEFKDRPSGLLFRGMGRSMLCVNIIPILNQLEVETGGAL